MASDNEDDRVSVSAYLKHLKMSISCWEEVVTKSQKLTTGLKSTEQSTIGVTDALVAVCSGRSNFSGVDHVVQLLSEVSIIERHVAEKISVVSKAVQEDLVTRMNSQTESWRRSISLLKRERTEDGRKARSELKKARGEVGKMERRIGRRQKLAMSDTVAVQAEYAGQDLMNKERLVEELERCVLKKAIYEERTRFRLLAEGLRPVLEAQLSLREDLDRLAGVCAALYGAGGALEGLTLPGGQVEVAVTLGGPHGTSLASSAASSLCSLSSQDGLTYLPPAALDESSSTIQGAIDDRLGDHLDQDQWMAPRPLSWHTRPGFALSGYDSGSGDVYSSASSQIYGRGSLLSMPLPLPCATDPLEPSSGTSTFKRRPRGTLTAMDLPRYPSEMTLPPATDRRLSQVAASPPSLRTGDGRLFKQQLMQVIQGGRALPPSHRVPANGRTS